MRQETILVVGASGTVGAELVRILKADGYNVRKTTSKKPADASSVQVNLATGEGLRDAFEGIDKAFLLSPPGYADQYQILLPLIQEAKRRELKKVVLMTSMVANPAEMSPMRKAELELEKSGLNYNIVRPNWFMQNFSTFWVHGIKGQGKIQLPAGQAKASFIDARDISAVVAKLLTSTEFENRSFDITGPQDLTYSDAATEISTATGKKVVYEDIDPQILRNGLVGAGIPADYSDFLIKIFGFSREGFSAEVKSTVKQILGREPRSLAAYAADHRQAWV